MTYFTLLLFIPTIINASSVFRPVETIDGLKVTYADINAAIIEPGQSSPGTAIYNEQGAFILYEPNIINSISELGKFLILEHERAHHQLGHTLYTKIHRELNRTTTSYYRYQKEKDADCAAGYSLQEQGDLFGSITRDSVTNAMTEIYHSLGGTPAEKLPSWVLSRISIIYECYKFNILPKPTPLMTGPDTFNKKIEFLTDMPIKRHSGPNSFNSALYLNNLSHQIRYTSKQEFHYLMESPYCKTVEGPTAQSFKIYRTALPKLKGAQREIHASISINEKQSFNKMSSSSTDPFAIEENTRINSQYQKLSPLKVFTVINEQGQRESIKCNGSSCENEVLYKKCHHINDIEEEIKRDDFKAIYKKILIFEREIASHLFSPSPLVESEGAANLEKLNYFRKVLSLLTPKNSHQKWQYEYFLSIINSLSQQIEMSLQK